MLKITKNKATAIYTPKEYCVLSYEYEVRDYSNGYTFDKWKTERGYSFNKLNENHAGEIVFKITKLERDQLIEARFKEIKI
jgi:hypothetical protein